MANIARVFSPKEKAKYDVCKATILSHRETARDWATALLEMKTTELYQIEFPTWEEWVAKYVPWSIRTIEQLFKEERASMAGYAGEVVIRKPRKYTRKNKPKVNDVCCGNEPNKDNKSESSSQPTPPGKKEKLYDQVGHEVPAHLEASYRARPEFGDLVRRLKDIKEQLESLRKGDRIWKKITTIAESHLDGAIAEIGGAAPHTVCTECQGFYEETKKGNCISCNSTGLMNEDQFRKVDKTTQQLHRTNHEATSLSRLSNSLP